MSLVLATIMIRNKFPGGFHLSPFSHLYNALFTMMSLKSECKIVLHKEH